MRLRLYRIRQRSRVTCLLHEASGYFSISVLTLRVRRLEVGVGKRMTANVSRRLIVKRHQWSCMRRVRPRAAHHRLTHSDKRESRAEPIYQTCLARRRSNDLCKWSRPVPPNQLLSCNYAGSLEKRTTIERRQKKICCNWAGVHVCF